MLKTMTQRESGPPANEPRVHCEIIYFLLSYLLGGGAAAVCGFCVLIDPFDVV